MHTDAALAALAARQHGLVTLAQALDAGLTRRQVAGRVRLGRWEATRQRVYRLAGAPRGWHAEVLAAVLSTGRGAVASHATSARLHGLDVPAPVFEVTVPATRHPRPPDVLVHRNRLLTPAAVRRVHGVPCTDGEWTVLDLGGRMDEVALTQLVDDAVCAGAADRQRLYRRAVEIGHRRARTDVVARLTSPDAAARFRSTFERRARQSFREAGLPEARWNTVLNDGAGRIGEVDACWPRALLVVELDGLRFHASAAQRERDRRRDRRLGLAGWLVLRYGWHDLRSDPGRVTGEILQALTRAEAVVS